MAVRGRPAPRPARPMADHGAIPPRLLVVGAGLMGASIALAADGAGWEVRVEDAAPDRAEQVTRMLPGGGAAPSGAPDLVCVAVPPSAVAACVLAALRDHPDATVLDIASVKAEPLAEVQREAGDAARRYVPTHPLAGSEVDGPAGARAGLFRGRTWVLCPGGDPEHQRRALRLVTDCGAVAVELPADVHDRLLAVTSHLPQMVASALAVTVDRAFGAATADAAVEPSLVAGPALLDMTRVAASPAALWSDVGAANREALRAAVRLMLESLSGLDAQLEDAERTRSAVSALVEAGARGRARISPKHTSVRPPGRPRLGGADPEAAWVWVDAVVDDKPGALARLFQIADRLHVNIEDLHVDHAPHAVTGVVSMAVRARDAAVLRAALADPHVVNKSSKVDKPPK